MEKPVPYTRRYFDWFACKRYIEAEHSISSTELGKFERWLLSTNEISNGGFIHLDRNCEDEEALALGGSKGYADLIYLFLKEFEDEKHGVWFEVSW